MAKQKKIKTIIKLQLPAGRATAAPPVGPVLGQHGVNIMEFVKAYNDATKAKGDMIIPVDLTVYEDRTFTFILKTPPASQLIVKAISKDKGSAVPNRNKIGKLTRAQVEEIAKIKMPDLNANSIEAAMKTISGTARSMGVEVES